MNLDSYFIDDCSATWTRTARLLHEYSRVATDTVGREPSFILSRMTNALSEEMDVVEIHIDGYHPALKNAYGQPFILLRLGVPETNKEAAYKLERDY